MYTEAEYRLLEKFKQLKKLKHRQEQTPTPTPTPSLQLQKPPALQINKGGGEPKNRQNGVGKSPLAGRIAGKEGTGLDATEKAKALLRGKGGAGGGSGSSTFKRPSIKRMAPTLPGGSSEDDHTAGHNKNSQFPVVEKHKIKMPKLDTSIMNGQTTLYLGGIPSNCSEIALAFVIEQHEFQPDKVQILEGGPNTITFSDSQEADRFLFYVNSSNKQITIQGQKIQVGKTPQELMKKGEINNQKHSLKLNQQQQQQQDQMEKSSSTFKRPLRKQLKPQNNNNNNNQKQQQQVNRQKSQEGIQQLNQKTRENLIQDGQNKMDLKIDDGRGVVTYEDI